MTPPNRRMVVAVDGPGGAGKGSVCRAVARRFDFAYLDTGLLYRAVALLAIRREITDPAQWTALAATLPLELRPAEDGDAYLAFLDQEEVTQALRAEVVGDTASRLATQPDLRLALLDLQRRFGEPAPLILDGRDTGTIVWPDADLKIFLTASLESRAKRRVKELQERGENANLDRIRFHLAERDQRDSERAHAPLLPASDAIVIDTSFMTLAQSTDCVIQLVADQLALTIGKTPVV